jgi:hypothetical protein
MYDGRLVAASACGTGIPAMTNRTSISRFPKLTANLIPRVNVIGVILISATESINTSTPTPNMRRNRKGIGI